ncbi:MAG: radical SAM protein [Clostridia bacterium]|nr:radical SAM protein [Clostridia bacterium]
MKITFINPPFKTEYGKFSRESRSPSIGHSGEIYYPLWLMYSAAYAKKNGFDIRFFDSCATRTDEEKTLKWVSSECSDTELFVLDTSTPSIMSDVRFGCRLKDLYPAAFILLVGTHPSSTAEETLGYDLRIDGVARHEYDITVLKLAEAIRDKTPVEEVLGLTFRKGDEIITNPDRPYFEDLDEIPFAAEFINDYLDINDYYFAASNNPAIQIFTGRGCPARCNFCVYPQTMHGHKYRLRSIDNVISEYEYIIKNLPGVKEIIIEDDTFTVNKQRVLEFCNKMIEKGLGKKLPWMCNARVNLDLETMKLMKKAGCKLIIPGIESVDQKILNNIRKGTTVEQIEKYIENAHKAKLLVHACYMVGNEGETMETMRDTLKAALRFNTDTAQFYPLIPYPGTVAFDWAKSNGYISGKYEEYCQEDGSINCVINTPGISAQQYVDFCAYARKKYYLRPRYILHRIKMGLTDIEDLKRSLKGFATLSKSVFKKAKDPTDTKQD